MTIKKFSTILNALARYALEVASIDKRKTKIFIDRLQVDITKDVLAKDNFPKTYTETVGRAQR